MIHPNPPWSTPLRSGWTPVDRPQRPGAVRQPEVGWWQGGPRSALPSRRESEESRSSSSPPTPDLDALVADAVARGADALGVAGGDGSLAVVAAAALAHGIPFVCIPAGTRNHFALDVGVDRRDVVGALDAFTDGVERRIDVARGERAPVPQQRVARHLRRRGAATGVPRTRRCARCWPPRKRCSVRAAPRPSCASWTIAGASTVTPRSVLVSNNPYALHRPVVTGTRPSLTSGRLGILVLDRPDDARRAGREPGRAWTATSLELDAPGPVHAGVDGESVELTPPLEFVDPARGAAGEDLVTPSRRVALGLGGGPDTSLICGGDGLEPTASSMRPKRPVSQPEPRPGVSRSADPARDRGVPQTCHSGAGRPGRMPVPSNRAEH